MRTDVCTICGGPFQSDRDGLWSGDKREHSVEEECIAFLRQELAVAQAALERVGHGLIRRQQQIVAGTPALGSHYIARRRALQGGDNAQHFLD